MSHGGKGSAPRPFSVSQKEYEARWDAIFSRDGLNDTMTDENNSKSTDSQKDKQEESAN
jgi:hypothetical protein